MIELADFFQPLNFQTLTYFMLTILFFDVLGTFIIQRFVSKKSKELHRITNWIVGLGIFIFLWFLLSFFIAYDRTPVFITTVILFAISLPEYIKNKEYKKLVNTLWSLKLPLFLIVLLSPAVYIKASLPPYYGDEAAYHFIPPSSLITLSPVKYVGGLYADLPRVMNLFYEISFSLTRTYSITRLTNFTILATALIYIYKALDKNFSKITPFLFVLLFLSLHQSIVLTSTIGYVDVAAYSFMGIGVASALDFIKNKNKDSLVYATIFWSLNLGTKYTGITALVSFLLVFGTYLLLNKIKFQKYLTRNTFYKIFLIFIVFGGYWYVKNFILYGNPIFPMLFQCWGNHIEVCGAAGSFFGNWTLRVNLANLYDPIITGLFSRNYAVHFLLFIAPTFALLNKNKNIKKFTILLYLMVVVELIILKYFSGFLHRYHQHMQIILLMGMLLPVAGIYRNWKINTIVKSVYFIIGIYSLVLYLFVVKNTNSFAFFNGHEYNYALGKINIYDWVEWKFPEMKEVIYWCEDYPTEKRLPLARLDPDLIWFEPVGQFRQFVTNCYFQNPGLSGVELDKALEVAKENKMQFWLASASGCIDGEVPRKYEYEADYQFEYRKLNNLIVCNAEEVRENLYYFDYESLL